MMAIAKFHLFLIVYLTPLIMATAQKGLTRQTVLINGRELYYEKTGKGTPLLLLHGWTQSSAFWHPYLESFQSSFEIYTIDLRGHGRSAPLTSDFSIQQAAGDIKELIRKLQLGPVKAIGFSYGALVLMELASSNPDLVQDMVVISASYRYNGQQAQKNKPAFTYENLDAAFKTYLKQQHVHGENQIKALFDPTLNYQINLTEAQLAGLSTNVFIIHGDSDDIADVKQAVDMHQFIPHSTLWVLPRTGHLVLSAENKDSFIRHTQAFLNPSTK